MKKTSLRLLAGIATQGLAWGVRQFSRLGYYGPCPPPGKPHNYQFRAYALDKVLGLSPRASKFDVEKAMKGHVLAESLLVGVYQR